MIEQQVRQFIVDTFLYGRDSGLERDASLLERGIVDSTGMLEVIGFLESTYGFRVQDHELIPENLDSIQNLVGYIDRKQREQVANAG
jgi:acyl carrier protein